MINFAALLSFLIIVVHLDLGSCLECYVCDNQEDNRGKCVTTIKTCEYGENVCLTEIKWGSTPYWQQGALKQYYISKNCSTKEYCESYRRSNMPLCTHISYQDWKCSECCKGDRCNYYIISGSNRRNVYATMLLSSVMFSVVYGIL